MADEITVSISARVENGNLKHRYLPGTKKFTQGTAQSAAGTIACSSASTSINAGNIASAKGWMFCTNLSTATDILLGASTAAMLLRIPPNAAQVFHLIADTTINVATTAGTANLQYLILST